MPPDDNGAAGNGVTNDESEALVDDHVFLVGRPPLAEYLGILTAEAFAGKPIDRAAPSEEWRRANDHVRQLEAREAGWADNPSLTELPSHLDDLREQVLADPIFQRVFDVVPVAIAMVELDRLVVFQKHINLGYVEQLREALGDNPTDETVFKMCLPFDHPVPPLQRGRTGGNVYVFVSPSNDLRFLEPMMLDSRQISSYNPPGPVAGALALVVGFGSNFLNAIHAENRLVLNNGSHRAFALREAGITEVPCIIQQVSREEELEVIATGDLVQNTERYLRARRPPVLKDYFDPALRQIVPVPRRVRQVRVTFGVEQTDVPAW